MFVLTLPEHIDIEALLAGLDLLALKDGNILHLD